MKNAIKLICLILLFAILLTLSAGAGNTSVLSYNTFVATDNIKLLCDGNSAYLVGINNKQVYIEAVFPKRYGITLNLPNKPHYYNLFGDNLVFVCDDTNYNQTQFVFYSIINGIIETVGFQDIYIKDENNFAFSNNHLYFISNNQYVCKFAKTGKLIKKIKADTRLTSLACDLSGNIYATSAIGLYKLSGDDFQKISSTACYPTLNFVNNNLFTDSYGSFFNIYNDKISYATTYTNSSNSPSGGEYGNYLIYGEENQLFAVNKSDNKRTKTKILSGFIEQFCVLNATTIALTFSNNTPVLSFIPFDDYSPYKEPDNNLDSSQNSASDSNKSVIYSNVYTVDNKNYKILKIPHSTTVAKFKKNMHYDGYNVEFTRYDGKALKSGKVGTGTIVRFYNDNSSYEYELSVIGDITGEGNVNSRDKKLLFDAVLDKVTLNGVYYESANLDTKNNKITVADIVVLLRMIESDKQQ